MQTAVRAHQPERDPALVDVRGRSLFKAADIVREKAEARCRERQSAAECLRHCRIVRCAVAAPVDGELLTACRRASRIEHGMIFALAAPERFKDGFIIKVCVIIMHRSGIGAVVPDNAARGDAFAEIGLDRIRAVRAELPDLIGKPCCRCGIGKINDRHAGLPEIGLEDAAVGAVQKIALFRALIKQRGVLRDIRIDPQADADAVFRFQAPEHALRIGEHLSVPDKACPCACFHPEAVEMEHLQGDLPLPHAVEKCADGRLVVIGRERGREPQPEGFGGRERRLSGQVGIAAEHIGTRCAADDIICERFAGNGHADARDRFGRCFIADAAGVLKTP